MNAEVYCPFTHDIYSFIQTGIKANKYRIPTVWQAFHWAPSGEGQYELGSYHLEVAYNPLKVVICIQDNIQ